MAGLQVGQLGAHGGKSNLWEQEVWIWCQTLLLITYMTSLSLSFHVSQRQH